MLSRRLVKYTSVCDVFLKSECQHCVSVKFLRTIMFNLYIAVAEGSRSSPCWCSCAPCPHRRFQVRLAPVPGLTCALGAPCNPPAKCTQSRGTKALTNMHPLLPCSASVLGLPVLAAVQGPCTRHGSPPHGNRGYLPHEARRVGQEQHSCACQKKPGERGCSAVGGACLLPCLPRPFHVPHDWAASPCLPSVHIRPHMS